MNPYAPVFSHPADLVFTSALVAAWLAVGAFRFRRRFAGIPRPSEQYCAALAVAFVGLSGGVATVFLTGLIFLHLLAIQSAFWFIWQLFWELSVIAVFRVPPFPLFAIMVWGHAGRYAAGYTWRTLALCHGCLLVLLLDASLYFASEAFVLAFVSFQLAS